VINKLDHTSRVISQQIFSVFQRSYKIEAALIGVDHFPPLSRTVNDIENADSCFYGFFANDKLAAVIEISIEASTVQKQLDICSLTVDPAFFRKGIAGKLLQHVMGVKGISLFTVETAVVNLPAIRLYQKHGFVEFKRWIPSHGIEKLALAFKGSEVE
jgi:ribosomal protein S18 acetylase RimI-like enzyme